MKATGKWSNVKGTTWYHTTLQWAPPTETETKIETLTTLIKPLETLLRFLEGFRAAKETVGPVTFQEVAALSGLLKEKKEELEVLKKKDDQEKKAKATKGKK